MRDEKEHHIEIIDFLGRVIVTRLIQSVTSIDLSEFGNGIYLVRVDNRTEKIIKN